MAPRRSHRRRLMPLLAVPLLVACSGGGVPVVPTPTPEQPRELTVTVVERASGAPIAAARVAVEGTSVDTDVDGNATVSAMRGAAVEVVADGFDRVTSAVPDEGALRVTLRSNVVAGVVAGTEGAPLAGVRVLIDGDYERTAGTDEDGAYRLVDVPEGATIVFKRAGYRLAEMQVEDGTEAANVTLEPFEARALYAPAATFERPGALDELLALVEETDANALVIDVKETDGQLFWATDLPQAVAAGATGREPLFDLEELLPELKDRGIYTIARMVAMKDNTLGAARPELAVMNAATGEPWRDNIGGIWLDPAAPEVAEYIAALAGDLAARGFDEVQLDYIRFFSDGPYDVADTNLPNTQSFRLPALRRVLRVVSEELAPTRAFLAADVFPISFIVPDDQGIGQRPETIMPYVDYFCPMVYPSHYGPGVFGFEIPNDHPYEVVARSLEAMTALAAGLPVVIRPWIQDFGYGAFAPYTPEQVAAQMQATADAGGEGWMIWNPGGSFSRGALGPPRDDERSRVTRLAAPRPPAPAPSLAASPAG